ncbi:uncharacterized protein [Solanum tuberosum]|uniref:uncharacterized protein n=1 Tax=Solanum tuberosum TaxID=4113 RepID=UPI00073A4BB8|nr:PREDICTED: uncharacterized protein LOC107061914 [Solanum tuberosum]
MNAVRPGLRSSVVYASDARNVWLDLRERFDTVNGSRIFQLHREIHSLTQGTMSIPDYHSRLRDLWDEYDAIMPCPSCPCSESKKFGEHCDYQRLLQFLMGLNESYSPPRSSILMMSPISSLNKAYAMLIDQESQRNLASNSSSGSGLIERTTMEQCYKIVGYPADFKSKRKPLNTVMYANKVDLPPNLGQETIRCSNKGKNASGTGPHTGAFFTSAQYQQILQLLSKPGGENTTEPCANIATTDDANKAREVYAQGDSKVHLPNGKVAAVTQIDLSTGLVKGIGKEEHDLYILQEGPSQAPNKQVNSSKHVQLPMSVNSVTQSESSSSIWHKRLGHALIDVIKRHECLKALKKFLHIMARGFFVTIVDDFSRYTWVFLIASKADTIVVLKHFLKQVQNVFSTTMKTLRTYNGCEFFSGEVQTLLSDLGIAHQSTCVYTPQQNGIAERKHRTIPTMTRSLRFKLQYLSSTGVTIFGCLFMGCSSTKKGYVLYDIHAHSFFVNKHVVFHEELFPFKHMQASSEPLFPVLDIEPPVDICSSESVVPSVVPPSEPPITSPTVSSHHSPLPPHSTVSLPVIHSKVSVTSSKRSGKLSRPSLWLQDFVTMPKTYNCLYPLAAHLTYSHLSLFYRHTLHAYSSISEPASFKEAAADSAWVKAMDLEIAALEANNTWSIVDLPLGKIPIECRWIYKINFLASEAVERFKARFVAKGFSQRKGLDYGETFSPVAKMVTVRFVVVLAASKGWYIYQMDVHNAFLNGDLNEEVYMEIPSGFANKGESMKANGNIVVVLVYVDDLLITGSSPQQLCNTRKRIQTNFKMKDLGELKFFLGIEFSRSSRGILMTQMKYALELIYEFGLGGAKPAYTPLKMNQKLISIKYDEHVDNTGPKSDDLLKNPADPTALRAVRYIKEAHGLGLLMPAKQTTQLTAYCDSDWGACVETKRSVTGYLVKFGDVLVSWKSKKQETVSKSSTEAEFRSMATCSTEITWLLSLYKELGVCINLHVHMMCDSKAAIQIAANPIFHERTKHIDIDCHFVMERICQGKLKTEHVNIKHQLADLLTKWLGNEQHNWLISRLGMTNVFQP